MYSLSLLSVCLVLFTLSAYASPLQKLLTDEEWPRNAKSAGAADIWALLVAGSSSWMNYRHQADVCHAYQILRAHGVPDDHIVVMMVDDIAYNENNPTPGVIINEPDGDNVYANVSMDYTGKDVTVANFLNILQGNKEAMKGIGSEKVIESGPDSYVFVNLVDHGAPGIFAFPEEFMHAKQLIKAIQSMYNKKQYKQMVVYVESCESGSLFDGLLPSNINVYATTAANSTQSSYACYYNETLQTFLGDVYSVKWMENVDKYGTRETLRKQYELVKQETTTSNVMRYGDLKLGWDRVSRFMGSRREVASLMDSGNKHKPCEDAVPSGDVPIAILTHQIMDETDDAKKAALEHQLLKELQLRASIQSTMHRIVTKLATTKEHLTELLYTKSLPRNFDCIDHSIQLFSEKCFNINKVEYAMRQLYVLVNLCEIEGMDLDSIGGAINSVC